MKKLPLRLRSLFGKGGLDRELDEEMEFHVERLIEEKRAAGLAPEAARRAALVELGGLEAHKEDARDARRMTWVHDLLKDLRFGLRMFSKNPGFTAVAVLILGLGIGATTAIFSFIDAVFLRSLPVRAPDELVLLGWKAHSDPKTWSMWSYGDCNGRESGGWGGGAASVFGAEGCAFSLPYFKELRTETDLFAGLVAFTSAPPILMSGAGTPSMATGQLVSGNYFNVLGIRPLLGRMLVPDDEQQASHVAVLSHATWLSTFGGDPGVIGRSVELNGSPFTIVGVVDPAFKRLTPGNVFGLYLPLTAWRSLDKNWDPRNEGAGAWSLTLVARLRPDVGAAKVAAAANQLFRRDVLEGPEPAYTAAAEPELTLSPAASGITGSRVTYTKQLTVMTVAVAIILAIACANVAGLLLSRAGSRRREMAVRLAMGAGRGRVIRQLLAESVLLAVLGGALGSLLAVWGVQAMTGFLAANRPLDFDIAVDGRVLGFTLSVSLVVGIVFGLAPAFRGTRVDLAATLRGETVPGGRARLGNFLVVAQVALSMLVLVGAGLLVRTLEKLRSVDLGFRSENVLLFSIDPTLVGEKGDAMDALYRRIRDDVSALPGVTSVTWSSVRPLSGNLFLSSLKLVGERAEEPLLVDIMSTGPGFFDTLGVGLVAGRALTARDVSDAASASAAADRIDPKVPTTLLMPAVVNEAFIRKFFEGKSPIGERFQHRSENGEPSPTWQIVGVVRDMKYNEPRRDIQPTVYLPTTDDGVTFEVRAAADPMALAPQIRAAVARLAPRLPIIDVKTQDMEVERLLFGERLMATLSSLFGGLALALACIGLYALLSYEVSRRAREVGIRMALGAQRGDVRRMVVKQGLVLVGVGIAVGLVASIGVTRFLSGMLFGIPPTDPVVLAGVPLVLLSVAALACYLPARRATRVDPMVVLRVE